MHGKSLLSVKGERGCDAMDREETERERERVAVQE